MTYGSGILNRRPAAHVRQDRHCGRQRPVVVHRLHATVVDGGLGRQPDARDLPMFNVSMAGKSCTAMTGACYAAPIWKRIMSRALDSQPVQPMP